VIVNSTVEQKAIAYPAEMVEVGVAHAALGLVERTGRLLEAVNRRVGGLAPTRLQRLTLPAGA
jgi:hypothetical protein